MKRDGNDDFAGGPRKRSSNGSSANQRKAPLRGQERKDHLANLEKQRQERAKQAEEERLAAEEKKRTPEVIEGEIQKAKARQQTLNFASMQGLTEEQVQEYQDLERKIPELEQQKVDKIAKLAKEREALLHSSANTVGAMQAEIAELRELQQKNPGDKELDVALQNRQWLVNDLELRLKEEKAEAQRKKNNEALRARRRHAIEQNDSSGLDGMRDTDWWKTHGKRQAAKWRIERCKEEALKRRAQSAPAPAPPAQVEPPASTHSSKDDWERDINEQLKALGKLAVREAQKQHKADEELFDKEGCYTEEDKQEQRERLARARGSGEASSSSSS